MATRKAAKTRRRTYGTPVTERKLAISPKEQAALDALAVRWAKPGERLSDGVTVGAALVLAENATRPDGLMARLTAALATAMDAERHALCTRIEEDALASGVRLSLDVPTLEASIRDAADLVRGGMSTTARSPETTD